MSPRKSKPVSDYGVGYGKPPAGSRWPKGQSGNPGGRPKGSTSLKTALKKLLAQKVTVRGAGGRTRRVTHLDAFLEKLLDLAYKGNIAAMKLLVSCLGAAGLLGETGEDERAALSPEEREVLASIVKRLSDDDGGGTGNGEA